MARRSSSPAMAGQISVAAPEAAPETMEFLSTCVLSLDQTAEEGQVVEIRAEPDNPADPKALAVYAGEDKIGYLANKPSTVRDGTKPAANLHKMVTSKKTAKTFARLTDMDTLTSGKTELTSFRASLYFVPKREEAKKPAPMVFRTYGGGVSAPGRGPLITMLQAEKKEPTDFTADGCVTVLLSQVSAGSSIDIKLKNPTDDLKDKCVSKVSVPDDDCPEEQVRYTTLSGLVRKKNGLVEGTLHLENKDGQDTLVLTVSPNFEDGDLAIPAAIDRVISRCIEQANTLEAKVNLMRKANIPGGMICEVLNSYTRYPAEFEALIPNPKFPFVDDVDGDPVLLRSIAYHLHGKHIRLVGEKGCGKNTLIETVDWLLRRPLFRLSGNSDLDKTDILGSRTIENGTMKYELTTFLKVLEAGGDVDLDECNAIKPDVELIIHSLTDQTRAINVPGYGEVKMGELATFWMTMNEDYIGTTDMNDATVDRFVTIRMQSPSDIKSVLKARVPSAADSDIDFCQRVYADMQRSVQSGELSATCISIRGFIDALECGNYLPIRLTLMDTLAAKPQDESERGTLQTIIENLAA